MLIICAAMTSEFCNYWRKFDKAIIWWNSNIGAGQLYCVKMISPFILIWLLRWMRTMVMSLNHKIFFENAHIPLFGYIVALWSVINYIVEYLWCFVMNDYLALSPSIPMWNFLWVVSRKSPCSVRLKPKTWAFQVYVLKLSNISHVLDKKNSF